MDPRLAEAARSGNTDVLYTLLREDPYLLENIEAVPFTDTPLHEAVISKQTRFAIEMMNLKPSFARKLNPDGFSPMHLTVGTSVRSPLQPWFVRQILMVDPSLARVKGREGMTPLHLAAKYGASDLFVELLVACPESNEDVNVNGQTALHIAVANGNIEVLEALIGWLCRLDDRTAESTEKEVLNKQDYDGNTALHVAAYEKKPQEMNMLLVKNYVDRNIKNGNGLTFLDVLQSRGQQVETELVLLSGAMEANSLPKVTTMLEFLRLKPTNYQFFSTDIRRYQSRVTDETRNALLVLSTLVITTTYQLVLQPPGGTDKGKVVIDKSRYSILWMLNTFGFLSAVFLVVFLVQVDALKLMYYFPMFPCMYMAYMISSSVISPSDAFVLKIPFAITIIVIVLCVGWYLVSVASKRTSKSDGLKELQRVKKVVQK